MLVSVIIFANVSNKSFIIQYFTVAIFCSKHHILISNTATKEVSEDKEFGYCGPVLHQRMEGEFPVTAVLSARRGKEQATKHVSSVLSLPTFMPSVH